MTVHLLGMTIYLERKLFSFLWQKEDFIADAMN
jgi:hypothetical protein